MWQGPQEKESTRPTSVVGPVMNDQVSDEDNSPCMKLHRASCSSPNSGYDVDDVITYDARIQRSHTTATYDGSWLTGPRNVTMQTDGYCIVNFIQYMAS